ncbi:hypothetical protein [Flavicella sediminum]|uniref:hypothetical protein n=1 Tax=Flavicella sediminum TaxID=2585141 RepID=UPI00112305DB|nr:hypothetical protein [Flavicella sediminum]
MAKIDNIKNLFDLINDKQKFYEKVADEFGMEITSVRTGWFTRFEIPKRYKVQDNLIAFMQNYIANQQAA